MVTYATLPYEAGERSGRQRHKHHHGPNSLPNRNPDRHAPALFIDLAIAGQDFKALLDTGASTSLTGDEVFHRLSLNAVRLRDRRKPLQLACGEVKSCGDVSITVGWNLRVRRMRFVHLPGFTVPVILGRDFMSKTGLVVDIGNGGYRESPFTPLKPFGEPPLTARPPWGHAADSKERSAAPKEPDACDRAHNNRRNK